MDSPNTTAPAPAPILSDLPRKDLVEMAKRHGIKANQKSSLIIAELQALSEFEDCIVVAGEESNDGATPPSASGGVSSGVIDPHDNASRAAFGNSSLQRSGAATAPSPRKGEKSTATSSSIPAWKAASCDFRSDKKPTAPAAAAAFGRTTSPTKSRLPPPPAPPAPPAFKANTRRQKDLPLSPRNRAQMAKFRERQQIARRELDAPPQAAFGHASRDTQSRIPPVATKEKVAPFKANTRKQKVMELSDRNQRQMEKFRERQRLARSGETKKAAFGHGTQTTQSRIPLGTEPNGSRSSSGGGGGGDDPSLASSSSAADASGAKSKKNAVPAWKVASRDFRRKPAAQGSAPAFGHGVSETKPRVPITTLSGGEDEKELAKAFRANTRKLKTMEMTERNRKQMEKFRQRQMAGREERLKKAAQEKEIMCSRD
jgi:hypothetical protein